MAPRNRSAKTDRFVERAMARRHADTPSPSGSISAGSRGSSQVMTSLCGDLGSMPVSLAQRQGFENAFLQSCAANKIAAIRLAVFVKCWTSSGNSGRRRILRSRYESHFLRTW